MFELNISLVGKKLQGYVFCLMIFKLYQSVIKNTTDIIVSFMSSLNSNGLLTQNTIMTSYDVLTKHVSNSSNIFYYTSQL